MIDLLEERLRYQPALQDVRGQMLDKAMKSLDTAARTIIAPQQLPVGVITALLGVPAFMFLLLRKRGGV